MSWEPVICRTCFGRFHPRLNNAGLGEVAHISILSLPVSYLTVLGYSLLICKVRRLDPIFSVTALLCCGPHVSQMANCEFVNSFSVIDVSGRT